MKALIVLNPHAASGRAARDFRRIESLLPRYLGDFLVAVTQHPEEVATHLHLAAEAGFDTVIAVGGDGTNQALVNVLGAPGAPPFTFASLPFGTGRDWARTLGIPTEPEAALRWLIAAEPRPVDVGQVVVDDGRQTMEDTPPRVHRPSSIVHRLFLNVASAGLSGEVDRRVNGARRKRPWTFLQAVVGTLLQFSAPRMRVEVDDARVYEGEAFILAVGNGRYFGRGMMICPEAIVDDGLFDVVLVEGMPKPKVLAALPTIFDGTHIRRGDVHCYRGKRVVVEGMSSMLGMDMDGEGGEGRRIEFEVLPAALTMLVDPQQAPLR